MVTQFVCCAGAPTPQAMSGNYLVPVFNILHGDVELGTFPELVEIGETLIYSREVVSDQPDSWFRFRVASVRLAEMIVARLSPKMYSLA